jgi:hypothetical protein
MVKQLKDDEIALAMALSAHTADAFELIFGKKVTLAALSNDELSDWVAEKASHRVNKCFAVLSDLIEEFSDAQARLLMAAIIEDPAAAGTLLRQKLARMVERDREAL